MPAGPLHTRAGFLPSRDGFAFTNAWPPAPAITLPTPVRSIGIGNAAAGLCGGMVFAALDYWHAGIRPAAGRPAPGSPLYRYLVRRQVASWHLPSGVARYYQWMNLPDSGAGPGARTVSAQWPQIRASLDAGVPAVLGLVTVASANPVLLRHNHQALAFGYTQQRSDVSLSVYDPNTGPDDDVSISFSTAQHVFRHNLRLDWPVRGFFLTRYSPAIPPSPERTSKCQNV
jgi:hypothetical protein